MSARGGFLALDLHRLGHQFSRAAYRAAEAGDMEAVAAYRECAAIAWDECDKRLARERASFAPTGPSSHTRQGEPMTDTAKHDDEILAEAEEMQAELMADYEAMRAKLGPVEAGYVPASYGDSLSAAELGCIGNMLAGAAGILRRIAMLPDGTLDVYPEWQRAATDACELDAAAEACWAERQRRLVAP